ncbi:MAG: hypothetical protein WD749_01130 [Phycisphaerales bacterium]
MIRAAAIVCLVLAWVSPRAGAQQAAEFWQFPPGTVAFWAVDPTTLPPGAAAADRNRQAIEAALAWAVPRVVGSESGLLSELLAPEVLGASRYRLALLEFRASHSPPQGARRGTPRVERFAAALEVHSEGAYERIDAALRAQAKGEVTARELAGGHRAHSTARAGAPQPGTLEWARLPGRTVVAFGDGALDRWLGPAAAGPGAWAAPRERARPMPRTLIEAWVDLDALRTDAPELFAYGRLGPLVHAWGMQNARYLFVSCSAQAPGAPGTPRLDVTAAWSSRSSVPGTIRTRILSEVPADHPERPLTSTYAYFADIRTPLESLITCLVETHRALSRDPSRPTAAEGWVRSNASLIRRAHERDAAMTVIFGPPSDGSPHRLGASTLLKPGREAERDPALFSSLFASLGRGVQPTGPAAWRYREPPAALRGLTWGHSAEASALELFWAPQAAPAPRPATP